MANELKTSPGLPVTVSSIDPSDHSIDPISPEIIPSNPKEEPFRAVTPEIMEKMFQSYYENQNIAAISAEYKLSYKTVYRLSKQFQWEERRKGILTKIQEKNDYSLEKATEQSILMVRAAKSKLAERLKELNPKILDPDKLFSEIERVIRLEQLLLGGTEERKETISSSHEERLKALRELRINAARDITPGLTSGKPN